MKRTAFALLLLVLTSTACAGPATRPTTMPFSICTGYAVKSSYEPDKAASFVVLRDEDSFDEVFGITGTGDKSHGLPADIFDSGIVVAVIKRGNERCIFHVTDIIAVDGQTLIVRYTTTALKEKPDGASLPLIVALPKSDYQTVRFEENGSVVKAVEESWVEIKQQAGNAADRADQKLNKVYKKLMAGLDADEKQRLVTAERAWIVFRDAECEFEARYTGSGTDAAVNYPYTACQLTEARTTELQEVLKDRSLNHEP